MAPIFWNPAIGPAALTAVAIFAFAGNSLLCRAALIGGHIDPATFTALRIASGSLTLGLLARSLASRQPKAMGWGSAVALFAYAIAFSLAYLRLPAGIGALLLFAAVQLTMIGAGLRSGERPRLVEWAGLCLSVVGLVVLTRPGLARPDMGGALLMLGAGAAWGAYSLRGRRRADALGANAANFRRAVPLALAAGGLAAIVGDMHVDSTGVLLAAVSGGLASGVGYVIWFAALRGLSAARAAIVQLAVPPLTAAGGVLVLDEDFSLRLAIASILILGGIALTMLGHQHPPTPTLTFRPNVSA